MNEGKAADFTVLDFGEAFDTVLYGSLLDRLFYCEINKITLCWVMDWLNRRAQGANGATSGCVQLPVVFYGARLQGQSCPTFLSTNWTQTFILCKSENDTDLGGAADSLLG